MGHIPSYNQSVTVKDEFECAYIDEGAIDIFNAHRYRVEVSVEAPQMLADNDKIIDFRSLKMILRSVLPDSKFLYASSSDGIGHTVGTILENQNSMFAAALPLTRLTAETICAWIANMVQKELNSLYPGVVVVEVILKENSNNYVTWDNHAWRTVNNMK